MKTIAEPTGSDCRPRRGYCAQCWSHHSRVYHWPGFDDDWPKEYYFEVSCFRVWDGQIVSDSLRI